MKLHERLMILAVAFPSKIWAVRRKGWEPDE
jgi:hypothetical protein